MKKTIAKCLHILLWLALATCLTGGLYWAFHLPRVGDPGPVDPYHDPLADRINLHRNETHQYGSLSISALQISPYGDEWREQGRPYAVIEVQQHSWFQPDYRSVNRLYQGQRWVVAGYEIECAHVQDKDQQPDALLLISYAN